MSEGGSGGGGGGPGGNGGAGSADGADGAHGSDASPGGTADGTGQDDAEDASGAAGDTGPAGAGAVDYEALFAAVPVACLVLDSRLRIVTANDAYLAVTERSREELVGRGFFEAYPSDPDEPATNGAVVQRRALEAALASGEPTLLMLHRFAIPRPGAGRYEPRWWNVVNQPVRGPDGTVQLIIHRIEDVTAFVTSARRTEPADPVARAELPRVDVFNQAQELQRANARLLESTAAVHDTALILQQAMLATPDLASHPEIAVRYRPAVQGMNACGDWYDVVDLPERRMVLTVGDVVGHGVGAASVMGMLRSALNAAVRVADGPSGALEALGLYARAHEGALATTTFACQVFPGSRLLTYSNAGHPPPVLVHQDGSHEFLDRATDPPLGVRVEHVPRPQATLEYAVGDLLVLYTDGLVERRGEDIDVGIGRLVDALRELRTRSVHEVADALLARLADPSGQHDDISVLAARL
ncbi:PP2C family protein-serine/threonine phosphatase [Actinacidiphila rubida]|uniref:PAS domain S-box-containing protein n=1 Tax=Actinacidiphila rubida TaxID=310780 RepID=A0A1H8JLL3_9ACTN|nr:SpoIIE family protein phosphatase [Actinacidiphila rubida]SEN81451.1 PAS domain S-box-containing protein [Actinacidiphila rubida]